MRDFIIAAKAESYPSHDNFFVLLLSVLNDNGQENELINVSLNYIEKQFTRMFYKLILFMFDKCSELAEGLPQLAQFAQISLPENNISQLLNHS